MTVEQVLTDREGTHGKFSGVASTAQEIKTLLHHQPRWHALSSSMQESLDLIATKLARVLNGDPQEEDHWADIAGYAELARRSINGL